MIGAVYPLRIQVTATPREPCPGACIPDHLSDVDVSHHPVPACTKEVGEFRVFWMATECLESVVITEPDDFGKMPRPPDLLTKILVPANMVFQDACISTAAVFGERLILVVDVLPGALGNSIPERHESSVQKRHGRLPLCCSRERPGTGIVSRLSLIDSVKKNGKKLLCSSLDTKGYIQVRTFEEYRQSFPKFYEAVKHAHANAPLPHRGHGLDHDVTVATYAARIAPNRRFADLGWIAGMIHSSDRMIGREDRHKVELFMRELVAFLPEGKFEIREIDDVVEAALRHMEKNQPDQSPVQVILMDADRLANLMAGVIIRSGQFNATIPALELKHLGSPNPESTYRVPCSVVDDLRGCIEWKNWFRTEMGKKLSRPLVRRLELYLRTIEQEYWEIGLAGIEL